MAINHFYYFLEGCSFTAYTDHKLLTFAISGSGDSWSPRQSRQLSFITEFTTNIQHIIGKQNVVAHTLSRGPISEIGTTLTSSLDFTNMAILQDNDSDIQAYHTAITRLRLQDITVPGSNRTLLCDASMHSSRLIIPKLLLRCLIFESVHNLAHPGVKPTQKLVMQRFVWHGIKNAISAWVRSCTV